MTKRLLAVLTALLLCFGLTACGGGGEESSAPLPDGITTTVTTAMSTAPTTPSTTTATTTTTTTAIQTTTSRTWSHEELYGTWKPKEKEMLDGKLDRELVWSDEFNGTALDTDKWSFQRSMSAKDRLYSNGPEEVQVANGRLTLTTHYDNDGNVVVPEGLTTSNRMLFRYGYMEMRACLPYGRPGPWPSWWMKTNTPLAKADYMAEIDIFEVFSSRHTLIANIHKWGKNGHVMTDQGQRSYIFEGDISNLRNEFHVYGFEWTPEHMKMLVDGEVFVTFDITEAGDFDKVAHPGMDGFHDFAYILYNNEIYTPDIGGDSYSWVSEESVMPQLYHIDWVRLYQKKGEELVTYGIQD